MWRRGKKDRVFSTRGVSWEANWESLHNQPGGSVGKPIENHCIINLIACEVLLLNEDVVPLPRVTSYIASLKRKNPWFLITHLSWIVAVVLFYTWCNIYTSNRFHQRLTWWHHCTHLLTAPGVRIGAFKGGRCYLGRSVWGGAPPQPTKMLLCWGKAAIWWASRLVWPAMPWVWRIDWRKAQVGWLLGC